MANNYLQFSFLISFNDEKMDLALAFNEAERNRQMTIEQNMYSTIDDEDDISCEYCFEWSLENEVKEHSAFWVYSQECGDPQAAIRFTQRMLNALDISEPVYFSWAETCSKLRFNEFAGGGALVFKDTVKVVHSSDVIKEINNAN